jgi:hypothetical protein
VSEEEESVLVAEFVEASEVDGQAGKVISVGLEDVGCELEGFAEFAVCEEEVCF